MPDSITVLNLHISKTFFFFLSLGPVTIVLDCKVTLDDVPIGLVLQHVTPFRFVCKRLWTEPIAEVTLPTKLIPTVLDPRVSFSKLDTVFRKTLQKYRYKDQNAAYAMKRPILFTDCL